MWLFIDSWAKPFKEASRKLRKKKKKKKFRCQFLLRYFLIPAPFNRFLFFALHPWSLWRSSWSISNYSYLSVPKGDLWVICDVPATEEIGIFYLVEAETFNPPVLTALSILKPSRIPSLSVAPTMTHLAYVRIYLTPKNKRIIWTDTNKTSSDSDTPCSCFPAFGVLWCHPSGSQLNDKWTLRKFETLKTAWQPLKKTAFDIHACFKSKVNCSF